MDKENNPIEDAEYMFRYPNMDIRVGDEYQVKIPPMMSESERAALLSDSSLVMGLPIEVMWISTKYLDDNLNINMNESLKSLKTKRIRKGENKRKNHKAVPEKSSSSWDELQVDGFVLGLYTFGKDFTQVKKLLETKETGEILSFYYGKFYKSAKYKIWYSSLKKWNRRCIHGKKLYSGWRLHQLLSRLIPGIPDESKKQNLVNVSKSYAQGNISLEVYISQVKELVGLRSLVDAVAIGKDKEDLTVVATEPVKLKKWFSTTSPGLGAYTKLTADEIIEKLSGGCRLGKARCNDIFWEAVWPRLLARGWNSEKPQDRGYIVFLVPGVEKFSRRKLVKNDHYFDSVSDILAKIVSEPDLLKLEIKAPNGFKSPGSSSSTHMKFTVVDTTNLALEGKLCEFRELKNPNPNPNLRSLVSQSKMIPLEVQKHGKFDDECRWERRRMIDEQPLGFMVVDTSVDQGGLRRRRHLPCKYPDSVNVAVQQGRSKKRFARKSEDCNVSSLPVPKRRRLSACVRKDIQLYGESLVVNPPDALDHTSNSGSMNLKTDQSEETGTNGFCSISVLDKHCSSKEQNSSKQKEDVETADQQEKVIGLSPASTSAQEEEEEEHKKQSNGDIRRRQSTRKRPLTTRALEALESGFITTKSMKTTSKPRQQEKATKIKHSTNGLLVKEDTASKPLDQIEELKRVTTEFPKLPPIVFKLPFKRF